MLCSSICQLLKHVDFKVRQQDQYFFREIVQKKVSVHNLIVLQFGWIISDFKVSKIVLNSFKRCCFDRCTNATKPNWMIFHFEQFLFKIDNFEGLKAEGKSPVAFKGLKGK